MKVTKYPIDFDALTEGSHLGVEEIARAVMLPYNADSRKFHFAAFKLSQQITRHMWARGVKLMATYRQDKGIFVLYPHEQAEKPGDYVRKGIRTIFRGAEIGAHVDRSRLTGEQQRRLDRDLALGEMLTAQLDKRRKQFKLEKPKGE